MESPAEHELAHPPLLHTSSTPHAAPQAPQLVGLDARFGHSPPHEGTPLAQVQDPNEQICSPVQDVSHSLEKPSIDVGVEASDAEDVAGDFTTSISVSPQLARQRSITAIDTPKTGTNLTIPTPLPRIP